MKQRIHLRLAVFLLDAQHNVKACATAEGQPRYAMRSAIEKALVLALRSGKDDGLRLVIIPAGQGGVLSVVAARAMAFSKAGQSIPVMARDQVYAMGKRAAVVALCGLLAAEVRAERPLLTTRVALTG